MDLDQQLPRPARISWTRDRLVVDIGLGAAVGRLDAAEDQVAVVVDAVVAQRACGPHAPAGTSKTAVTWPLSWPWRTSEPSPRPPRASDRLSRQDGLAGPGLAGQHREAAVEAKIEPFDQDDIADRKPCASRSYLAQAPMRALPAREIQEPAVLTRLRAPSTAAACRNPHTTGCPDSCGRERLQRSAPRRQYLLHNRFRRDARALPRPGWCRAYCSTTVRRRVIAARYSLRSR